MDTAEAFWMVFVLSLMRHVFRWDGAPVADKKYSKEHAFEQLFFTATEGAVAEAATEALALRSWAAEIWRTLTRGHGHGSLSRMCWSTLH